MCLFSCLRLNKITLGIVCDWELKYCHWLFILSAVVEEVPCYQNPAAIPLRSQRIEPKKVIHKIKLRSFVAKFVHYGGI